MTPSLDNLRTAIDGNRDALCAALGLRPDGGRFFCPACQCDGQPHAHGDFSVEAGFCCHKCGWKGDGFDLVRLVKGCDFPAAVECARSVYGIRDDCDATGTKVPPPGRKPGKIHARLDDSARAACWAVGQRKTKPHHETSRWPYHDAGGNAVAYVIRFEPDDGARDDLGKPDKTFMPVHAVDSGWKVGDPQGKWPLFNLPAILASAGPVFVCEGEKASCAGAPIGLTCTTSAHGAKSPSKTDWRPLSGRDVIILPDHDRAGRGYAETVAGLCHAAGARSLKIVDLPGLPPKGDLADFIIPRAGQTKEEIRAEVERLAASTAAWTPPKRDVPPELPRVEVNATLDPIEAARAGTPFAMTDLGNAERLCAWHGDAIRWDCARKAWRTWDGRRWAIDDALAVNRRAAETARKIRKEAAAAPPGNGDAKDLGAALFAWAVKSESRERLAALLEVAKARPGIAVAADDLDTDHWVLNVLNGTIDLRTGSLRPHNRADLLTKLAPVEYDPAFRCERWERFLSEATGGDAELVTFLQVVAGHTLTGDTSEEKLFLVYGPEASGKTTFLESLRAVLGEYAVTIQADLLTKHRNQNNAGAACPELARLAGIRLAAGSEMEQGREMAEALAKNLSGGESITARHLFAEFFDFMPQFKLWLALNHCPRVSADDGAIWRRILRIGFEHTVPPERRDKTLKTYLRTSPAGRKAVLSWATKGCLRWQREGLHVPDAVARSTAAYRKESDPLDSFIEDCLEFTPAAWTTWASLWEAYNEHSAEAGTAERYRVAPKRLQERLKARGCEPGKRFAGRGWSGVELKNAWKTDVHGAHGGNGTFSERFSTKDVQGNDYEVPPCPPCPPCDIPPEPAAAAVQSDFLEGYTDDIR